MVDTFLNENHLDYLEKNINISNGRLDSPDSPIKYSKIPEKLLKLYEKDDKFTDPEFIKKMMFVHFISKHHTI